MKQKTTKIIILISLILVTLIWNLIFWLPDVSVEVAQFIYGNPITHTLTTAYDDFFVPLICVMLSFGNLVFALLILFGKHQSKKFQSEKSDEKLMVYWVYTFISLGALVIHCIGFHFIFQTYVFSQ